MAYVHQDAQALGLFYIFPSLVGESAPGNMGAGKYIGLIPPQGGNPEANLVEIIQQCRVKAEARRALDGEDGRHLPCLPVCLHLIGAVGKANPPLVLVHLPLNGGKLPLKRHNGRYPEALLHHGGGVAGKALAIAIQAGCTLQINVERIFLQASGLVDRFSQQSQGRIAVQVKYRDVH